jgi:hypothetical protein
MVFLVRAGLGPNSSFYQSGPCAARSLHDDAIRTVHRRPRPATFANGLTAAGSFSKTIHGADNQFEVVVIGTRKSARWEFLRPDEIVIGEGNATHRLTRANTAYGSGHAAWHGLGWIEGYVEIIGNFVEGLGRPGAPRYPDLPSNLALMRVVIAALKSE